MGLGIPDIKHKQFYESSYFNIKNIKNLPANSRKVIFLKRKREGKDLYLEEMTVNCDRYL